MSDFKKGLLVGISIIIGCGTFISTTSKETSKVRYSNLNGTKFVLDTWSGKMFSVPSPERRTELAKGLMPPYYDVLGVVHPRDYNLKTEEQSMEQVMKSFEAQLNDDNN